MEDFLLQCISERHSSDEEDGEHQPLSVHLSHHLHPTGPQHHPRLQHQGQPHKTVRYHQVISLWQTSWYWSTIYSTLQKYFYPSNTSKLLPGTFVSGSKVCVTDVLPFFGQTIGSNLWTTSTPTITCCSTPAHGGSLSGWTSWPPPWRCWWLCLWCWAATTSLVSL